MVSKQQKTDNEERRDERDMNLKNNSQFHSKHQNSPKVSQNGKLERGRTRSLDPLIAIPNYRSFLG